MEETSSACELRNELQGIPVLNWSEVLENLDYDLELYRELIEVYLERYADSGDHLAEMLDSRDLKVILSEAHALKGISANIGALRLQEITKRMQAICRNGELPLPEIWGPVLLDESAALKQTLEQLEWSALETLAEQQG